MEGYESFGKPAKPLIAVPKSIDKRQAQHEEKKAAKERKAAGDAEIAHR